MQRSKSQAMVPVPMPETSRLMGMSMATSGYINDSEVTKGQNT